MNPIIENLQSRATGIPPSLTRVLANAAMGTKGILPLWFGEPNEPTPAFICESAAQSMASGDTFYSENLGHPFLRQTIADYLSNLHDSAITQDRIAITAAGANALNLAFQVLLNEGDTVVTLTPSFVNLIRIPEIQGAKLETFSVEFIEGEWKLDCERFIDACEHAKVVLINSPSNPTGFTLSREEMTSIMDSLRERGIWLISDEVYSRLVFNTDKAAPSFLDLAGPKDKLIVVNSFSKAWSMTGWRLGWLVLPNDLSPVIEKITEFSISCTPVFTQKAGATAILNGEPFIQNTVDKLRNARNYVVSALNKYEAVTCPLPQGAFYAFFHVKDVENTFQFAEKIIQEAKVGLAPGEGFLLEQSGWFRLCFAQTDQVLQEALKRLDPILNDPKAFFQQG